MWKFKKKTYDKSSCREGMIDYIIRVEQPFNMMETHEYLETIQTLINPQFKGWSENTVKRGIMKKFQTERENFKKYFANFEGKICLTSDIWTSLMHRGFFCETQENSNFLKNGKIVISVKIRNFSRSRMTKRTSPLESSREI